MMLGTTDGGDAYTFAEYEQMFRNAGYTRIEAHRLDPSPETLLVSNQQGGVSNARRGYFSSRLGSQLLVNYS